MKSAVVMAVLCLVVGGVLLYEGISKLLGNSPPTWLGIAAATAAIVLTLIGRRITRLKKPK